MAASTSLSSALCRFVEYEDRRVLQQHARNGDALTLAARQLYAALADVGLIGLAAVHVLEAQDELMRVRAWRAAMACVSTRFGTSVEDVVEH